jgi:hypothetical protein
VSRKNRVGSIVPRPTEEDYEVYRWVQYASNYREYGSPRVTDVTPAGEPANTTWVEVSEGALVVMQKDMDQTQPDWILVCENQDVVTVKVVRD